MAVFNVAVTGSFNSANYQSTVVPVILSKFKLSSSRPSKWMAS